MAVKIGRYDGEIKEYGFREGETIADLLRKAGLTLSNTEEVDNESGDSVRLTDPIESGGEYYIVATLKNGI